MSDTDTLWIKREGDEMICSAEPFEGAVRFVATGKRWTRSAEDERLVGAFHKGASSRYLSDNPYAENSELWLSWRAGFDWQASHSEIDEAA